MDTQTKQAKRKRIPPMSFRVSPEERSAIRAEAKRRGMPHTAFVRLAVLELCEATEEPTHVAE